MRSNNKIKEKFKKYGTENLSRIKSIATDLILRGDYYSKLDTNIKNEYDEITQKFRDEKTCNYVYAEQLYDKIISIENI